MIQKVYEKIMRAPGYFLWMMFGCAMSVYSAVNLGRNIDDTGKALGWLFLLVVWVVLTYTYIIDFEEESREYDEYE